MIIIWGLLQGLGKGQGLIILISFCRHFFNSHWSPSFQCKWRITLLLRNDLRVTIFHWTMLGGRDLGVCISWVQNHQAILLIIYVLQAILYIHIFPEGSVHRRIHVIYTHLVQVVWNIPEKRRPKNNSTYRRLNQFDQTNGLQKNILGGLGSRGKKSPNVSLYEIHFDIFLRRTCPQEEWKNHLHLNHLARFTWSGSCFSDGCQLQEEDARQRFYCTLVWMRGGNGVTYLREDVMPKWSFT